MKKTICRVDYDTENSELIRKNAIGNFGDSTGYEESLYLTASGHYFLYFNGGADSPYPTEDIRRLSKAKAEAWLAEHNA